MNYILSKELFSVATFLASKPPQGHQKDNHGSYCVGLLKCNLRYPSKRILSTSDDVDRTFLVGFRVHF